VLPGEVNRFFGTLGIAADSDPRGTRSATTGARTRLPRPASSLPRRERARAHRCPGHRALRQLRRRGRQRQHPVTFIGCATTSSGLSLVRVNQSGRRGSVNPARPSAATTRVDLPTRTSHRRAGCFTGQGPCSRSSPRTPRAPGAPGPPRKGESENDHCAPAGRLVRHLPRWARRLMAHLGQPGRDVPRRSPRSATPARFGWFFDDPGVVNGTTVVRLDRPGAGFRRGRGAVRQQHRLAASVRELRRRRQPDRRARARTQASSSSTRRPPNVGISPDTDIHSDPIQGVTGSRSVAAAPRAAARGACSGGAARALRA